MSDLYSSVPKNALFIIQKLNDAGFEAFLVGGCVRDLFMGRSPKDWDITTSALPLEVKNLFDRVLDTGIKHGTVTIILDKESYEVTTYRIDGPYQDCRRPDDVFFTQSLTEDLARRDFTMNAIAYHPQSGYFDPFGGLEDINNKIIRAVGEAYLRFGEDALRMMRAFRFSAQTGFPIEQTTHAAIKANSTNLTFVSWERIRDELIKLITGPYPHIFLELYPAGLLDIIMPEFIPMFSTPQNNPHHIYNIADHTIKALSHIENSPILRLVMLLHDIGKPSTRTTDPSGVDHFYEHVEESVSIAQTLLNRLKLDNHSIDIILMLIAFHDRKILPEKKAVKKVLHQVGVDNLQLLLQVKEADAFAQNPVYYEASKSILNQIQSILQDIIHQNECFTLKDLAINGHDLLHLGFNGKQIGKALDILLNWVIEDPSVNQKEILLSMMEDRKELFN